MALNCIHCNKSFKNKNSMYTHQSKFQGGCAPDMTDEEFNLLGPVQGNWTRVYCKTCDKSLAKRAIFDHIKDHHADLTDKSWYWWIKLSLIHI